jgi:ketosteroid isomerase-like protein
MQANEGGQTTMDMWSRGTRVFRRRDGRWQMIHQHVSFPFDPASGKAVFDAGH